MGGLETPRCHFQQNPLALSWQIMENPDRFPRMQSTDVRQQKRMSRGMTMADDKVRPSLIRGNKVIVQVLSGSPCLHQQPDSVRGLRHAPILAAICQIAMDLLFTGPLPG
jgi:hypothetical protein